MDFSNPNLEPYVREAYEEYLMADPQQRTAAMNKLIEGSNDHKFLVMLDKLTKSGKPFSPEDLKKIYSREYDSYDLRQGVRVLQK
jgi:hypothetical protein